MLAGQLAQLLNLAEMTSLKTQICHAEAPSPQVQHARSGPRRDRKSPESAFSETGQTAACGAKRPLGPSCRLVPLTGVGDGTDAMRRSPSFTAIFRFCHGSRLGKRNGSVKRAVKGQDGAPIPGAGSSWLATPDDGILVPLDDVLQILEGGRDMAREALRRRRARPANPAQDAQ